MFFQPEGQASKQKQATAKEFPAVERYLRGLDYIEEYDENGESFSVDGRGRWVRFFFLDWKYRAPLRFWGLFFSFLISLFSSISPFSSFFRSPRLFLFSSEYHLKKKFSVPQPSFCFSSYNRPLLFSLPFFFIFLFDVSSLWKPQHHHLGTPAMCGLIQRVYSRSRGGVGKHSLFWYWF